MDNKHVRLSPAGLATLEKLANERGATMTDVIRDAIRGLREAAPIDDPEEVEASYYDNRRTSQHNFRLSAEDIETLETLERLYAGRARAVEVALAVEAMRKRSD